MVPPRGRGNGSRSRTHGRDLLNGGRGGGKSRGGSRGGGGIRGCWSGGDSSGGGGNRGCWSDGGSIIMAKVGAAGRGRRRLPHPGPEAMSSVRHDHGWVGEGEEMERKKGFRNELE